MAERLVFGEADPHDYWEPLCVCGHIRTEHSKADGSSPPAGAASLVVDGVACWYGWEGEKDGCYCTEWRPTA